MGRKQNLGRLIHKVRLFETKKQRQSSKRLFLISSNRRLPTQKGRLAKTLGLVAVNIENRNHFNKGL